MATTEQRRAAARFPGDARVVAAGLLTDQILHELANGVFLTRNLLELALETVPADAPVRVQLEPILGAADEQADVMRAWQRFSGVPADADAFALDAAVEAVATLLRRSGALRRVELELDAEPALVVGVPQARVEQLVLALVLAAARGLPEGGCVRAVVRDGDRPALEVRAVPPAAGGGGWAEALAEEIAGELGLDLVRGGGAVTVSLPAPEEP